MIFCSARGRGLAEYRLSVKADAHLDDLYVYGVKTFEAYHSGLARIFGLIADFPLMGPNADFLKAGLRRFRFQSHFIYYTVEADHLLIQAILPQRMDVKPDLFE